MNTPAQRDQLLAFRIAALAEGESQLADMARDALDPYCRRAYTKACEVQVLIHERPRSIASPEFWRTYARVLRGDAVVLPDACAGSAFASLGYDAGTPTVTVGVRLNVDCLEVRGHHDRDRALVELERRLLDALADVRHARCEIAAEREPRFVG
ncbi:MAG: hypothetical protein ACTHU0_07095 [Kofleriaceae bacterium]